LRKDFLEKMKSCAFWHLWFLRRRYFKEAAVLTGFWPKYDFEIKVMVESQT
jgi:hypothetical protein